MLSTLPLYLAYVGTALALLIGFTAVYMFITPYRELHLIRQGNCAAAYSLGGTLIGFALVLSSTAAHSANILDMAVWGAVAMGFQVLVFVAASFALTELRTGMEADKTSYGVALGAMSIAMGLINAGAVTT